MEPTNPSEQASSQTKSKLSRTGASGAVNTLPIAPSCFCLACSWNAEHANALGSYRGRRLYPLDYVGFPTHLHAEMLMDMRYTVPTSKEFTVVRKAGQSGSSITFSNG